MTATRLRMLAVLLALACVGALPATGSIGLGGALLLWLHGSDHAHAVVAIADAGHVDLVLAHHEAADHDDQHPRKPELSHSSFPDSQHVLHLDAAQNATRGRGALDASPVPAAGVATARFVAPRWVARVRLEPRARGVDFLNTVVLRL